MNDNMKKYVIMIVLIILFTGCMVGQKQYLDVDTRALHGKMLIDMQQGKEYVIEYAEDGKYYIHDINTNNGNVIFRK